MKMEKGFLCPWAEEKYGGSKAGFEYSVILIEEMAREGVSIPTSLHSDIIAPYIATYGTEEHDRCRNNRNYEDNYCEANEFVKRRRKGGNSFRIVY